MLQQLQKQASPAVNGQTATFPYNYSTLPTAGLAYAAPNGVMTAYDPRTMLMPTANKLKMLPKLEKRFAPY